mgnify:CR=1 FL=1
MSLEDFALILIGLGALIGLVAVVYAIRKAFSRGAGELGGWEVAGARQIITAIARTTLTEGLRTKIASGFVIMVVASVPIFWLTADGDGTIKGRVQMFMTYSVGFSSFILSLLSVLFSCRSLSNEIAGRQIFGIVSKPVPRWQIVMGKFFGVMTLNVVMVAYVGVTTFAGTRGLVSQFKSRVQSEFVTYAGYSPEQAANAVAALDDVRGVGKEGMESPILEAMSKATGFTIQQLAESLLKMPEATRADLRRFDELRRQVLVARTAIQPPIPEEEIARRVEARFNQMKADGELPITQSEREIRDQLNKQFFGQFCTVVYQDSRMWVFEGPPPQKGKDYIMSVRFKMHIPQGLNDFSDPETGAKLEEDTLLSLWGIGDPKTANYYEYLGAVPARTTKEFEFPMDAVDPNGTIKLRFANLDPRRVDVVFDLAKDALEVLYRVGSFEMNLFEACLAVLIPLACLTAFGVCASTFLSFPVGALLVLCLFMITSSMGFIFESMAITEDYMPEDPGVEVQIRKAVIESIDWALSIGDIAVTDQLMEGRAIGWDRLWSNAWRFLLLKTGAALFIAVLVLRRRELAAVIV